MEAEFAASQETRSWNWRPCHTWLQVRSLRTGLARAPECWRCTQGPQEQSISQTMVQCWRIPLCLILNRKHQSCWCMWTTLAKCTYLAHPLQVPLLRNLWMHQAGLQYTKYRTLKDNHNNRETSEKKKPFHEWPLLLQLHCYLPTHHCPRYVSQTLLDPSAAFFKEKKKDLL